MKLIIKNKHELDAWMSRRMRLGHDMDAVKGPQLAQLIATALQSCAL